MKSMKSKGPKERNLWHFSKPLRTFLLMHRCFSHCRSLDRTVCTLAVVKWNSLNFLRQINHGCTHSKCHRNEPPFHILHIFMGGRLGNARGGFDMEEQEKRPPLGWVTNNNIFILFSSPNCKGRLQTMRNLFAFYPYCKLKKMLKFCVKAFPVALVTFHPVSHSIRQFIISLSHSKTRAFHSCWAAWSVKGEPIKIS